MNKMATAHVIVYGRVHGVFFRMETKRQADKHNVSGWVRNKEDGSVEAVFEGEMQNIEAVIQWCHSGPSGAYVKNVDVRWEDYKKQFNGFAVMYY